MHAAPLDHVQFWRGLQERRRSLLLQLRVGLATCLRGLVKPLAPPAGAAGTTPGGLGPGGSELLLLCGPDNHVGL